MTEYLVDCDYCTGIGKVTYEDKVIFSQVTETCPKCGGTGKVKATSEQDQEC